MNWNWRVNSYKSKPHVKAYYDDNDHIEIEELMV